MQKKIYNPSPPSLGGYNLKSKLNNSYKKRYRFKAVKVKGMGRANEYSIYWGEGGKKSLNRRDLS